jgi:hypothetical protein
MYICGGRIEHGHWRTYAAIVGSDAPLHLVSIATMFSYVKYGLRHSLQLMIC